MRLRSRGAALLGALALTGCAAAGTAARPEATPAGPTVTLRDGALDWDGGTIAMPTTVAQLNERLGPCSRRSAHDSGACVWDQLGLVAHEDPDSGQVSGLDLELRSSNMVGGADGPAAPFRGRIVLPGGSIDAGSTPRDFAAAGLVTPRVSFGKDIWGGRLGRLVLLAMHDDHDFRVMLHSGGLFVHTAAGEPPLFTIRARENGCDFDEDLVELEREGNTSVVRIDMYGKPSQRSVGKSMFDMGAVGALAKERGFAWFVELGPESRRAEAPAGGGSVWHRIGFANDEHADVASEFASYFGSSGRPELQSSDWAMVILGDWPELGVPEATVAR